MKKSSEMLKMNIRFFGEGGDSGADGAGAGENSGEQGVGDGSQIEGDTGNGTEETKGLTEDEVLLRIETERAKWIEELEESQRLSKLPPEQREKEETLKKDKEIQELKQKILTKELQEKATKELTKLELPIELTELVDYSTKENMETSLVKVKEVFTKAVEKEVLKKLRGGTPRGIGGTTNGAAALQKQIAESVRGGF